MHLKNSDNLNLFYQLMLKKTVYCKTSNTVFFFNFGRLLILLLKADLKCTAKQASTRYKIPYAGFRF